MPRRLATDLRRRVHTRGGDGPHRRARVGPLADQLLEGLGTADGVEVERYPGEGELVDAVERGQAQAGLAGDAAALIGLAAWRLRVVLTRA